ncbi:maker335 [Drosophila busckii]|uniref:Maker335 n=1 Tax=Drosophila busckii TaxID=30019 RepID=A0A0M4EVP5_DROBS|nr:uncharacterized protein LOC108606060 [Drosophila busckii]ALC49385.1 maker335 [Drosophila busckii]
MALNSSKSSNSSNSSSSSGDDAEWPMQLEQQQKLALGAGNSNGNENPTGHWRGPVCTRSSEEEFDEAFSDSDTCYDAELYFSQFEQSSSDYDYIPLTSDSDVEQLNSQQQQQSHSQSSDESVALLAHEMPCDGHDSYTDTDTSSDEYDDDDDDKLSAFMEMGLNYAPLKCSELSDDDDDDVEELQLCKQLQQLTIYSSDLPVCCSASADCKPNTSSAN